MSKNIKSIGKEEYPGLLCHIDQLPDSMEYIGELPSKESSYICIVGSREHTKYATEVCDALISRLKGLPIVIVSGLAIGVDSLAHEFALRNEVKTMAFPGSGLDPRVLYPAQHVGLARRIVESGGTLISPFKRMQPGAIWTFPKRNRLMAGISHATLIVEAKKGSGTLITADHALEFNRDVLAVPGSIFNETSYGPNMLISRGARIVSNAGDIIDALGLACADKNDEKVALPEILTESLKGIEKELVSLIAKKRMSGSDLAFALDINPARLNTLLSELEIRGLISERDGIYSTKAQKLR